MRFFLVAEVINSSFLLSAVLYLYHWIHLGWTFRLFSVQFSCSVLSNSLRPYGLQHTWLPCPSPIPRAFSNSCASSRWCHATISSSVVPFSSCSQSFQASGSFLKSQLFASGGQSLATWNFFSFPIPQDIFFYHFNSLCVCPFFWSDSLVGSIQMGLALLSIRPF